MLQGVSLMSEIKFKGRNKPSKRHIYNMMKEHGELNTHEIHDQLKNKGSRLNLSMNTLVNIMARSPYYYKAGYERIYRCFTNRSNNISGKYSHVGKSHTVVVWGFKYE